METVFSSFTWKEIHDIHFVSERGRQFCVDFTRAAESEFDVSVRINDDVSDHGGSWLLSIACGHTEDRAFEEAVRFVIRYLSEKDPQDRIARIYNPCNDPFIRLETQNSVLSRLGIPAPASTK